MAQGESTKEVTIKEQTEELQELLKVLLMNINNLVERNPQPTGEESKVSDRPDNVFDEIIRKLRHCRGLIWEATEKVQDGISRKVQ